MMQGWIRLNRSLLENQIFNSEPYTKGQAWITLLMLANHREGYITVKNGDILKIERGECGYSELALADIFKWSRGKVKRFLNLLENEKMIQQKSRSNRNIINIINYDFYQNDTVNETLNDTVNGHLTIHQTDTNKNDKNDKNVKNDSFITHEEKKLDPFINPTKTFFQEQYTNIMGKTPRLSLMECNRLTELASENKDIKEIIPEAIRKLKKLKFDDIKFTPSANWLLKGNNFERLLNGEFDAPESEYERLKRKFGSG
jgi:DNA replication protein DnaD